MRLKAPKRIRIGALGIQRFPPGWYVYCGSALNGLGHRIRRHLCKTKIRRWHIDYLRRHAEIVEVAYTVSRRRLECPWARALLALPGASIPAKGFGSSDCRCPTHLVRFDYLPKKPFRAFTLRSPQRVNILSV